MPTLAGPVQCINSNGLILYINSSNFRVLNPVTRQCISFPKACLGPLIGGELGPPGFPSSEFDIDFMVVLPYCVEPGKSNWKSQMVKTYTSKQGFWKEFNLDMLLI